MAVKIHHGPPGSCKTSGAIADDLKEHVYSGRLTVTNIRGMKEESIRQVFLQKFKKPVPEEWRLMVFDPDSVEDRRKLATFFHWAPNGAFFIVDEVGEIWPPQMTVNQLSEFNYPGGEEQAEEDDRFFNLASAFRMHRHREWDFVFTAQDIAQVHRVIRECCEMAFYHKHLKNIGFKNLYSEGMHSPRVSGTSASHYIDQKTKKVPKWVFDLYASTVTGEVSDGGFGSSVFKQVGFILPFLLLLYSGYSFLSYFMADDPGADSVHSEPDGTVPKGYSEVPDSADGHGSTSGPGSADRAVPDHGISSLNSSASNNASPKSKSQPKSAEIPLTYPLSDATAIYWQPRWRAEHYRQYIVRPDGTLSNFDDGGGVVFVTDAGRVSFREREIVKLQVFVNRLGPCVVELRNTKGWRRIAVCEPEPVREPEPENEDTVPDMNREAPQNLYAVRQQGGTRGQVAQGVMSPFIAAQNRFSQTGNQPERPPR
ncbi:MAG: hypothetical protein HQL50_12320 [Magnetococcales bacterium]|nr:hypothetical protein [Magnetococcales bacterium]